MSFRAVGFVIGILGAMLASLLAVEYHRHCDTIFRFWDCRLAAKNPPSPASAVNAPVASEPEVSEDAGSPAVVPDGWTAAGVHDGARWTSRLLSFPATARPEDLVGSIVTPTLEPGNYLRAHHPQQPGGRGEEIGVVDVGDRLKVVRVHTLPSTAGGVSVWVAVQRIDR